MTPSPDARTMDAELGAPTSAETEAAYRTCAALARAHYENFPVASWLVPRGMRRHVAAVYAFARVADDIADEGARDERWRLDRLAAWRVRLHAAAGAPLPVGAHSPAGTPSIAARSVAAVDVHPAAEAIFVAVADTIRRFELDVQLFDDLLDAFRQDVTVRRYATWADVLDYCRRSANPVGRLVLALARADSPEAGRQSDAVCTALQLTNFWQDFGRDWTAGRLYVPRELLDAHGASEADIEGSVVTPPWRAVFADLDARTAALFDEGRGVADHVRGRLRFELRATWLGGSLIRRRTAELRRHSFDARPTLRTRDALIIARDAILWR